MKSANIIAIVLLLVGLGAGFFGGMQYQKNQVTARGMGANRQGRFGGQFGPGGGNATRPVVGDIISSDDKSITVKLPDGSSQIIVLSVNTTINKADKGVQSDLKSGVRVAAFGTQNSDGSLTATSIQINPMFRMGGQNNATPGATEP